jgi:hypothetical protein
MHQTFSKMTLIGLKNRSLFFSKITLIGLKNRSYFIMKNVRFLCIENISKKILIFYCEIFSKNNSVHYFCMRTGAFSCKFDQKVYL